MTINKQNAIVTIFLTAFFGLFSIAANAAAPVNDFWSGAVLINGASGSVSGTVLEATTQSCELDRLFPDETTILAKKSVWYKWLVPANGSYTFKIAATQLDSTLSAYRFAPGLCNGSIASLPNRIVENHIYDRELGDNQKSRITFRAVAGEVIYLAVDSYYGNEGSFSLSWEKTKFRYSAQLDYNNGGTDINITRSVGNQQTQWWTGRYGNTNSMSVYEAILFGKWGDKKFLADYDGDGVSDFV